MKSTTLLAVAGALTMISSAMGQVSYTGPNVTENFDGMTTTTMSTTGVHVALSGLNGWYGAKVAGNGNALPYITDTGGSNTGGLRQLGSGGEFALGALSSGTNTPGFGVAITNNSASPVTSFTITFDGEQWRSSTSVANTLVFAYGTSAAGITAGDFITNAAMTPNAGGDIIGAAPVTTNAAINPPTVTPVSLTISGLNVAVGETIFLCWRDTDNAGSDAALAIDNFVFTTGGGGGGGAAMIKNVVASPTDLQMVPGNVTYTFSAISNTGGSATTDATITATFPAGVNYNAGASSLPPGATADFTGGMLTLHLGNVDAGGTVPDFTVVMTTTVPFPTETPLAVSFASAPGTDVDNTTVTAVNNTNTVQTDDIAHGLNYPNASDTLRLVRPAAGPGNILESWTRPFIELVEFDNKSGTKSNPLGNLLGVDFGNAATGGIVYAFPTQALGTNASTKLGSFTDASTFTHGVTTSAVAQARLSGLSVSFCNDKIALTGYENGAVYVFDYANTGDGLGALSNGRSMNDGINNSRALNSVGSTWIDNTHLVVAATSASGLIMQVYNVTATSVDFVSATTVPGDFTFTDVEFNPGVPAPLNTKVIVAGSNFVASMTINKLFVFDLPTAPDYTFSQPTITADNSTSMQSSREIAFDSAGNLYLSQFGGAATSNIPIIEKIAFNSDLALMFTDNNTVDFFNEPVGGSSFNGLDVAAGTTLPSCDGGNGGCQPADIADDQGNPLPSAGSNGGVNEGDYNAFFQGFFDALAYCDIADDQGNPLPSAGSNGGVNEGDYNCFFQFFFNGCP